MIKFHALGNPKPGGSFVPMLSKYGKPYLMPVQANALREWRKVVKLAARLARPFNHRPWVGGISIEMFFYVPRGKTVTRPRPTVVPDVDKLERAVLDSLSKVIYADDKQVVRKVVEEWYATETVLPGVYIEVQEICE